MATSLGDLSTDRFLKQYWQKKPCLLRQAFASFEPLLDGDDLAGLACEEMAESRLISGSFEAADWDIRHGPFIEADFSSLPEENWTLLVQDVEKHYAPLQVLMQQFSFIPNWRLDDLMISYAARGGSVGPHVDQYDVFLLQAEGRRRWQISGQFEPELLDDCALNVLKSFVPEQEWILEPGDMLYLPPNVAHHGVALDPGMTWSIGSRAPSAADLLQGLGEWFAFTDNDGGRFSDPDLRPAQRAGEIDREALQNLRGFMLQQISDAENLDTFLASFMSRFRLAHEPVSPPVATTSTAVHTALVNGEALFRNPWTRLTWIETETGASLFAAGQAYDCVNWFAQALCENHQVRLEPGKLDRALLETLTALINKGHFLLAPAD